MNARFYYISQKMMDLWATEIYQFFFIFDASITKRVTENTSLKPFFCRWDEFGQIKNLKKKKQIR